MFLVSTRNFSPDVGGIQNLMEGLSNALLNHGPVKIFADTCVNSDEYDRLSKLDILRVGGFKIFKKYRKANLIKDFVENNKVRAIFFDHWKSLENINENILKNIPSFCLIHSKEINHEQGTHLNKRMIKSISKAKFIIANSNFTKNLAIKMGITNKGIKVINPGCNYPIEIKDEYLKKAEELTKESFPVLITIARLDKRKGHQNILMCIKNLKVKFPKIKYISVGDGKEKNNLQNLQKELRLKDEVLFLNTINEQFKVALLKRSNLFLMPSIVYKKSVEGFGISFIEAACYGKGSIGGKDGGEKDAIQDGRTGYICDGNDLGSINESIIKFFEKDNYKKIGLQALDFSKKFKWNKIIKEYLQLI